MSYDGLDPFQTAADLLFENRILIQGILENRVPKLKPAEYRALCALVSHAYKIIQYIDLPDKILANPQLLQTSLANDFASFSADD